MPGRKKKTHYLKLDKIRKIALTLGWVELEVAKQNRSTMVSFDNAKSDKKELVRVNVWSTGKMSIALWHPSRGRNQQYKNGVTYETFAMFLVKPRLHTNGGYRNKEELAVKPKRLQAKSKELKLTYPPHFYNPKRYPWTPPELLAICIVRQTNLESMQRVDNYFQEIAKYESGRQLANVKPEIIDGLIADIGRKINEALGYVFIKPLTDQVK